MSVSGAGGKARVLALHGYLQNAEVFRSRTGALRKALKKRCDFVFVNGPHEITVDLSGNAIKTCDGEDSQKHYGWWVAPGGGPPRETTSSQGWEKSLETLDDVIKREGPFDGILGFSMGSAASSLLLAAIESGRIDSQQQFKWCLLFGGFVPRDPKLAAALTEKALPIPSSLHYSGKQDELVVESRSLELFECFDEGTRSFETHPQGHCIPSLKEVRERVKAYVNTVVPDPNVS